MNQKSISPLFDSLAFPGDAFCEAYGAPAAPREHWRAIVSALGDMGPDVIALRQERLRRMRHEDGAAYNPFDDPSGRGIPWALDVIPLPLTAAEWAHLEVGITQRALLLEQILADTYGAQDLIKKGRIAPELVFANPRFLRTCHGIVPPSGRFLTYYAADLYRAADGRFRVFRDHGANPAGLGYALENRIVISRILPELYHDTRFHRLAPFFQTFQRSLSQRCSLRQDEPGIVLLSPGPDSRIYFEHALLSRYLGYPLVEGQDLTVRNGEVFLKKLAGLEPVAAIFRHTEDCDSDPFALRRDTTTGVAGLIQVCREGGIDIVNPIGSGFVETPALAAFLPGLCRHLTGGDLLLENHPVWWCGSTEGLSRATAPSEHLTVGPALDRRAAAGPAAPSLEAIRAQPHAYVVREPFQASAVPAWENGGIGVRRTFLRLFACATDRGFAVLPGGLAVTAHDVRTLTGDVAEHQQSKDIWILSDRPMEPVTLMGGLQAAAELRRGSDLPSRVADHLLWLGRYLERAEGLIRLLRSVFRRFSGETRPGDISELPFLLNLLRSENTIPAAGGDGATPPVYRELTAQLQDALYCAERPESVLSILKRVQEAARLVRDRLSPDAWRVINRLESFAETPAGDPLELLDDTLYNLNAFSGLAMESMTRGLGWRFMDMGRRMERAMNQTGLMRISLPEVCTASRTALEALLEVSDSIMTYRARYRSAFQLAPVLDLLLLDESNPKSLAFQLGQLETHVAHLPREGERRFATPEERMVLEMLTGVRLLDLSGLSCRADGTGQAPLAAFLEATDRRLKEFASQITAHYLSRVPATSHFSAIFSHRTP